MTLHDQLVDFARSRGGRLRYGPQDLKPKADTQASDLKAKAATRAPELKPKADPWIDYTDDYTVWKQGQ